MNKLLWFFVPKSKKLEMHIDNCIKNKLALWIKTPKYSVRLDFENNEIEVIERIKR
jgi:hypothetical protein